MPLTSCVGNLHTQDEYKCSVIWASKVVANQATHTVLDWNKSKTERASQVWNQEDEHKDASSVFEAVVQIDTCEDGYGDDESVRDLLTYILLALHEMCKQSLKIDKMMLFRGGRGLLTCMRVVTNVEKPNPLMIIVPKFEIPPLGTLQTTPRVKNI
jgi:hypothetical protein